MLRVLDKVHDVLRYVLTAVFCTLIFTVALQVFSRTFLPQAPVWTEEYSRVALVYAAALGAGWALRTGDMVNVDIVIGFLGRRTRLALEVVVMLAIIVFCYLQIQPAMLFVKIGSLQTSPALEWNMGLVHAAVLLAPVTIALAAFERILLIFAGKRS
jgi:TRAP-type C4-dicarboxylate transport system permease small subunit